MFGGSSSCVLKYEETEYGSETNIPVMASLEPKVGLQAGQFLISKHPENNEYR